MSVNILKEFLIHFHTFRNVDLINQGLYQIRSRIFYTEKNLKYMALPYFFVDSKESENTLLTDEQNIKPHNIITNHISESSSEYVTKTFLIRYSDEEVELDEFCYFRIEVPYSKIKSHLIYHVEFELFFSDALMHINKEKKSGQNVLNNVEFKSVSNQVLLLNFDGNGFLESFSPIVYSDSFSSTLNTSVHMIVLDYKLRVNNLKSFSIEENLTTSTNVNVSQNKFDNQEKNKMPSNGQKHSHTNNFLNNSQSQSIKKKSQHINSLIQFFLDEKPCEYKLEHRVIDELYEKYVLSLVKNYLSLRIKYKRLVNKLLDEKMKSELPFFVVITKFL
jgi:hypothetical protein